MWFILDHRPDAGARHRSACAFTLLYFRRASLAGSAGALIADSVRPHRRSLGRGVSASSVRWRVGMRQRGMSVLRSDIGMLLILNLVLTFAIPRHRHRRPQSAALNRRRHLWRRPAGPAPGERRWWEPRGACAGHGGGGGRLVLGGLELAASGLRRRSPPPVGRCRGRSELHRAGRRHHQAGQGDQHPVVVHAPTRPSSRKA